MLGSAIGGYVDPINVTGPRLSDAMAQTSTVGGVIPFGDGVYVTAGNIIWRDVLKEHKNKDREGGKGGGQKTTTYTYTRSYAVGVCQAPIYGFHWIKRNGKKVYTSSPTATADEKAYSAKWLRKATLYLGDEAQMPDSTIVAVEGVGNVAPNRGLAYIVVENDDLTDMQGAIPQYEFCVRASPPEAYLTSRPYAQIYYDRTITSAAPVMGRLETLLEYGEASPEKIVTLAAPVGGKLFENQPPKLEPEAIVTIGSAVSGKLREPPIAMAIDAVLTNGTPHSASLHSAPLANVEEPLVTSASPTSGKLYVP